MVAIGVGKHLPLVCVHSAIYETYLVYCSFPEIYAQLEEGVELVYHGYMCILLYVKLIWCSGIL